MCAGRVAELPGECCAAGVVTPAAGVVMRHCRPVGKATFSMLISAATQELPWRRRLESAPTAKYASRLVHHSGARCVDQGPHRSTIDT